MARGCSVIVCGDRNWSNREVIERELRGLDKDVLVVHGDCRGADKIGGAIAAELGLKVVAFPANWSEYGRAAGPIRNRKMLTEENPFLVLAFHDYIENSRGTKDMINAAKSRGVEVRIFTSQSAGEDEKCR